MQNINNQELQNINGGSGLIYAIGLGLAALGTFVASVIYGYINPNKCNN